MAENRKVVLASLSEDPNLGEQIVRDSFAYVLRSLVPDVDISTPDLCGLLSLCSRLLSESPGGSSWGDCPVGAEGQVRQVLLQAVTGSQCVLVSHG